MRQKTVQRPVTVEGNGLHSGLNVKMSVKPAPEGEGISFIRTDLPGKPPLNLLSINIDGASGRERRTTIASNGVFVETTEHLLAACYALGIDTAVIEVSAPELPALDGSAAGFLNLLREAGIREYSAPQALFRPDMPLWASDGDSFLAIFPDGDDLTVSYTLSYIRPRLLAEHCSLKVTEDTFVRELSGARTFCFEEEALELRARGFGLGATYENTLVLGPTGPIENTFRYVNEPVRHKVVDLIGDLSLAGCRLSGKVIAVKSGHTLNLELASKIRKACRSGCVGTGA